MTFALPRPNGTSAERSAFHRLRKTPEYQAARSGGETTRMAYLTGARIAARGEALEIWGIWTEDEQMALREGYTSALYTLGGIRTVDQLAAMQAVQ